MPGLEVNVSFGLAFLAGLVSFLSPCVLPVVPGYITFISGVTLEDLASGDVKAARLRAAGHAVVFGIGFGLVFMTLGATASAFGGAVFRWLPTLTRFGGLLLLIFGLHLVGALSRIGFMQRERRIQIANKPVGLLGTLAVGVAFGAGWTPCIGPILASILLFAGMETTALEGTLLLGTYGLGLAIPFVGSAIAFNWFLAGAARMRRFLPWIEKGTGTLLIVVGLLMLSGHFAALTAILADMGQLVTLEVQ